MNSVKAHDHLDAMRELIEVNDQLLKDSEAAISNLGDILAYSAAHSVGSCGEPLSANHCIADKT